MSFPPLRSASVARRCIEDGAVTSVAGPSLATPAISECTESPCMSGEAGRPRCGIFVCTCGCEHPHHTQGRWLKEDRGPTAAAVLLGDPVPPCAALIFQGLEAKAALTHRK